MINKILTTSPIAFFILASCGSDDSSMNNSITTDLNHNEVTATFIELNYVDGLDSNAVRNSKKALLAIELVVQNTLIMDGTVESDLVKIAKNSGVTDCESGYVTVTESSLESDAIVDMDLVFSNCSNNSIKINGNLNIKEKDAIAAVVAMPAIAYQEATEFSPEVEAREAIDASDRVDTSLHITGDLIVEGQNGVSSVQYTDVIATLSLERLLVDMSFDLSVVSDEFTGKLRVKWSEYNEDKTIKFYGDGQSQSIFEFNHEDNESECILNLDEVMCEDYGF